MRRLIVSSMPSRSNNLSPDTLTERWLRELGWTVDQCQRQMGSIKRDLHGFADQHAFAGSAVLLVQTTTVSNLASRRSKVLDNDNALKWKKARAGNLIWLVGWKKSADHLSNVLEEIQLLDGHLTAVRIEDATAHADVRGL